MEILKPDICIYHGDCQDGFGAAWAVWKRWPDVEFIPGVHGNEPPFITGKNILIVDFSYKRPVLETMAYHSKSLTIIDHHKTAQADLEGFEKWSEEHGAGARVKTIFDMNSSGAVLTWKAIHPIRATPSLLKFIEDRDLWQFKLSGTKEVSLALSIYPMDFKVWDSLALSIDKLISEGENLLRHHNSTIEKLVAEAYLVKWHDQMVPCCNVPHLFASDVGNALLKRFQDAPFAMTSFRRGDKQIQVSLRSEDHRLDVSEIAKAYGGGGHRNAAGFQWPTEIY